MPQKTYSQRLWENLRRKRLAETTSIPAAAPEYAPNPTCSTLKLSAFIRITTTGDLSHLGNVADPEQAWADIYSEYVELSQDAQSTRGLELAKQIAYLTNRINITNEAVGYMLSRGYVAELCEQLRQMGYRLQYRPEALAADLQRTLSLSKSDHVKLASANQQYTKLTDSGAKAGNPEFEWFRILAALAKHRGVTVISAELITVSEYIAMDLEFREYVAASRVVK